MDCRRRIPRRRRARERTLQRQAVDALRRAMGADQRAVCAVVGEGDRARLPPFLPQDGSLRGQHPDRHVPGRSGGAHLLPRSEPALHRGRQGPVAHPLAVRHRRLEGAAGCPGEAAGVRQLPFVLRRWRGAGHGRGLRQRQGIVRDRSGRRGDGPRQGQDHHLERLQEGGRRPDVRHVVPGFSRRPLRGQHGEGPVRVRAQGRPGVQPALLPFQGHPRGLRPDKEELPRPARGRRPAVRPNQPGLESGREIHRVRQEQGAPGGAHQVPRQGALDQGGVPGIPRGRADVQVRPVPDPVS